jgi:hypothetical protein
MCSHSCKVHVACLLCHGCECMFIVWGRRHLFKVDKSIVSRCGMLLRQT